MTPTGVRRERHVVSTGRVDNSRQVIADAQLYRLSRVSSEWRRSQQPRLDVLLADTGIPGNSNTIFEIRGPTFHEILLRNLFLCISLANWSKIKRVRKEFKFNKEFGYVFNL